jgi:multidrug efflux pump subunit AcrB
MILKFFLTNARLNYTLFVLVFVIGIFSYTKLPKEIFPSFDLDMIQITGSYSGASIDTLDKIVVSDIEDGIKSLNGVDSISSIVNANRFSIIIELQKSVNIYDMVSKIKDVVSELKSNFPSDMTEPSVKSLQRQKNLLDISISSDVLSINQLKPIAEQLKSKILNISNISEVTIYGNSDIFYEIILDDKKIEGYGIDKNSISYTVLLAIWSNNR